MTRQCAFWVALSCACVPGWAADDIVSDSAGTVIGQRRNARSECAHLLKGGTAIAPKAWQQCHAEVDKHNEALNQQRQRANSEIAERRKRRSLEDELNASKSTAAGVAAGDGQLLGSGYANSTGTAAARAGVVGARVSDTADRQTRELKRAFDEFDAPAASPSTSGTSARAFTGASPQRSAFEAAAAAPPPAGVSMGNDAIAQYQTAKRAEEVRQAEQRRLDIAHQQREERELSRSIFIERQRAHESDRTTGKPTPSGRSTATASGHSRALPGCNFKIGERIPRHCDFKSVDRGTAPSRAAR